MAEGPAPTEMGLPTRRLRMSRGMMRPEARSATYISEASGVAMAVLGAEPRSM